MSFRISNKQSISLISGGSSLYGDGTNMIVETSNYGSLRLYTGNGKSMTVTQVAPSNISGVFFRDISDSTTADNGATVIVDALGRRWKRSFSGNINLEWFGAVKDTSSTDNVTALINALNYCQTNSKKLYVPGQFILPTWTTLSLSSVAMVGDGPDNSKIIGPQIVGAHFVNVTTGYGIDIDGIGFELFDRVFISSETLTLLSMNNCVARNNRSYIYRAETISNISTSVIKTIRITRCRVENCPGFAVHSGFDSAIATDNIFRNIRRDLTLWPGTDEKSLFCIAFGDGGNPPVSIGQTYMKNVIISNNSIYGVNNSTPESSDINAKGTTNPIMFACQSATVTGNVIRDVSAADTGNCESIYCKAQNFEINNNTIYNGTKDSACIAIKGYVNEQGPFGKKSLVSHNTINSDASWNSSYGIVNFGNNDCEIYHNIIENMQINSILVFKNPSRVNTCHNRIRQYTGSAAIYYHCNEIHDCMVDDNIVDGLTSVASIMTEPILLTTTAGSEIIKTILVTDGGSGYISTPTVYIDGIQITDIYILLNQGVVASIFVNAYPTTWTTIAKARTTLTTPVITISAPPSGRTATAVATVCSGSITNISTSRNSVYGTPTIATGNPRYSAISVRAAFSTGSALTTMGPCNNIRSINNVFVASDSTTSVYFSGLEYTIPVNNVFRNIVVRGLDITSPDPTVVRPVVFNYTSAIYQKVAQYDGFSISNVTLNGKTKRIPTATQLDDTGATFVVDLSIYSAVGIYKIGAIKGSTVIMDGILFTPTVAVSANNTASFAFYADTVSSKQILAPTVVNTVVAAASKQLVPNGTASNIVRAYKDANDELPIYLYISGEAITSGIVELILKTEAYVTNAN